MSTASGVAFSLCLRRGPACARRRWGAAYSCLRTGRQARHRVRVNEAATAKCEILQRAFDLEAELAIERQRCRIVRVDRQLEPRVVDPVVGEVEDRCQKRGSRRRDGASRRAPTCRSGRHAAVAATSMPYAIPGCRRHRHRSRQPAGSRPPTCRQAACASIRPTDREAATSRHRLGRGKRGLQSPRRP